MMSLFAHPEDTYLVRHGGFVLVIDRAARADDGDYVIARFHESMILTQLNLKTGGEGVNFEVWGKVMFIIFEV
jgi:SOS-response transcriptional repressor LexA